MRAAKKINITEFKQRCLELLQPERLKIAPLEVTRHGRVVALVHATQSKNKIKLKNSVKYLSGDIAEITFEKEWS